MTAAEHIAYAEQLEHRASDEIAHDLFGIAAVTAARAQVHATLALAVAVQEQTHLAHGVGR